VIFYLAPGGLCGLERYIEGPWLKPDAAEIKPLAYEDVFAWRELPTGTWIFTGVQQLPPVAKQLAERVWKTLRRSGQRVLNQPAELPSRHGLHDKLHRAGINSYRSWFPDELDDSLIFPVFVRQADQHTGNMSGLLTDRSQLDAFLRWQRFRGYRQDDLLIVEFCDTRNKRNEYRKYAATCVAGDVAAQYLSIDEQWMVKYSGVAFRNEWAHEEREYIRRNPHADELAHIFRIARIDYGRIDYGLLDGRIQVWEINTNPSTGGPPLGSKAARTHPELRKIEIPARQMFFDRLHSMLRSIDTLPDPNARVELCLPRGELRAWRNEVRAMQRVQRRRELISNLSRWAPFKRARDIVKGVLGVEGR